MTPKELIKKNCLSNIVVGKNQKVVYAEIALTAIEIALNGNSNSNVKYIPYQKCPICQGRGAVQELNGSAINLIPCRKCNGLMVIPMFEIKQC